MLSSAFVVFLVASGLMRPPIGTSQDADLEEIARLESVWNESHVRGNAEALDRLWAEDLVVIVPNMRPLAKSEAIGVWRSGRMRFQRYDTSDVRTRLYGDTALVTGRLQRSREVNGRLTDDDWRFTKVYVRRGGVWQVVAFHASPAAP